MQVIYDIAIEWISFKKKRVSKMVIISSSFITQNVISNWNTIILLMDELLQFLLVAFWPKK